MSRLIQVRLQRDRATNTDRLFDMLCAMNGFYYGLKRNLCLKVVCFALWLATAALCCYTLPGYFFKKLLLTTERANLALSVRLGCGIVFPFVALCWKLIFIVKNEDFGSVLQRQGRRFSDVAPLTLCFCSYLYLNIEPILRAIDLSTRLGELSLLCFDFLTLSILLLYNDAVVNILRLQADLKLPATTTKLTESQKDGLLQQKWRIRDLIRRVNELFALPLVMLYSKLLIEVLFFFGQLLGRTFERKDVGIQIICQLCYFIQIFSLAKTGSQVKVCSAQLGNRFLKEVLSGFRDSRLDDDLIATFRYREEWDVLKVACFTVDAPNLSRYLTFCFTFVALLLQFDYKVVGYVNHLG